MRVNVIVDCEIELDEAGDPKHGDPLYARMQESVREAIENAVRFSEGRGFVHDMHEIAAIEVKETRLSERGW